MKCESIILLGVFIIFGFYNPTLSFDVADSSAIINSIMLQISTSKQYRQNNMQQSALSITNRFQTLYASLTNQLNRVVKNHSPVQNNTNVTSFLQSISSTLVSGVATLNSHISNYSGGLDQFDWYNTLLSNVNQYLFDNVRGTLKPNLMSCFPLSNGYFIAALFQSFTIVQNCYLLNFDSTSQKMSGAINLQMVFFESTVNTLNSQFWNCISPLITDDAAVSCVNNLIAGATYFTTYTNNVVSAALQYNLTDFNTCATNQIQNTAYSVLNGTLASYVSCLG